ncbi:MAG TPA: hypothetical protein VK437_07070 [Steroidobacteraceae bacterium]|nr:hypothetical protein [Steroidobacteraceae bacterium]
MKKLFWWRPSVIFWLLVLYACLFGVSAARMFYLKPDLAGLL